MPSSKIKGDITQVLQAVEQGTTVSDGLIAAVYRELHHLAASRMALESAGQTLQATALVNEAWLRLFKGKAEEWQNRGHFFASAELAMRRILIERARRRMRVKRGERAEHVSIDNVDIVQTPPDERLLMIEEALERLQKKDGELAQVVMLKFFGGLTNVKVAESMGITERTVQNKWVFAKAWLLASIRETNAPCS